MDKGIVFRWVKIMEDFDVISDDCDVNDYFDFQMVNYMMIFVKMFVCQIDDFKIGVGVVIVKGKDLVEIVIFGWNGFLFKVLYGEFL